jgi:serine kinase of HPr protein (carbohydrate metabolism regulator)
MITVYGTSIAVGGEGVLLRGPSGSGKSDLALRLIEDGALLVADDQTVLRPLGAILEMSPPPALAGLIEVRGLGIVRVPHVERAPLRLVFDLMPEAEIERLPEPGFAVFAGLTVPLLLLAPSAASAPARLRLALKSLAAPLVAGALAAP